MTLAELAGCFAISTIGFCGLACPSTSIKEGWPANIHLASHTGQLINAALALAGGAIAAYQGGAETALRLMIVALPATYVVLRHIGYHSQRMVLIGELAIIVWAVGWLVGLARL